MNGLPIKNTAGLVIPGAEHPWADLALLPIFSGITMDDLAMLLQAAWVQHFSDGHPLFQCDQSAGHFFAVLDGHVEVSMGKNLLEVAQYPTLLGETALLDPGYYMESARIVGHSRLLVVPGAAFAQVLTGRFDLALRLLSRLSARLHGLVTQISSLKMQSTAQRLAGFLLGIADSDGTARFPYDKRLAAELLGMSAESLSRALDRLQTVGVHRHDDQTVTLDDVAALRAFCGQDT